LQVLFSIGWIWPAILIVFAWLIPESPNYLVRKGENEKAQRALERIFNETRAVPLLNEMVNVHNHEKLIAGESSNSGFVDCFKGGNWRRTRIILYCNGLSQMTGATFLSNGPYFLIMAGMSSSNVGMMVEIGLAFAIVSSILTWFFLGKAGRRTIILFGIALSALFFLLMGISSCFPSSPKALW
jgi:hypothetical protein